MAYPQHPYQPPAQTRTVTTGGLPVWMHLCYLFLGWMPCFLGWVLWPIHWWFAKSKTVQVTHAAPVYPAYPPPPALPPAQPYQQQQFTPPPHGYAPRHTGERRQG